MITKVENKLRLRLTQTPPSLSLAEHDSSYRDYNIGIRYNI